jgi:hypothetical protein
MDKKTAKVFGKTQTRERVEKLRQEINHHRYLYHVLNRQEISDAALDSLKHGPVKPNISAFALCLSLCYST